MTLEEKMKRNIKKIEDARMCPREYYLTKAIEEAQELTVESHIARKYVNYLTNKENLYEEIADVLNCIEYLTILFDLDKDKIARIMFQEVDREYERGVK